MWDVSEPFSDVDVAVIAEGTYPFARGGVSSVIHNIIAGSPHLSFGVIHLGWDGETPKENQFTTPANLRWVKTVFLSPKWGRGSGKVPPAMKLDRRSMKQLKQVLSDLKEGRYDSLKSFYHRQPGLLRNISTESSPLLTHIPFLKLMVQEYFGEGLSYLDALWLSYEFTGLLSKLLAQDYPKAKVYHSHTNGYAGLAAIIAKWQNGGQFLLSEHALYVRDAIAFIPEASSSHHHGGEHFPIPVGRIRAEKWEQWFRHIGHFVYQHIDASSYLYEGAFEEAKAYGYPTLGVQPAIIPNGIDLEAYAPLREGQVARNSLREAEDYSWTIGFIGRVAPIKGVLEFIDIIALLAQQGASIPVFRVLLVGPTSEDPEYYSRCRDKVRRYGLDDIVYFTGMQNVQDVLSHLDIVAIPSRSEAFPMVCLEAMASGIPLVAHDVGCIRQILAGESADAGSIVAKGDAAAFAAELSQLMTCRDTYQAFQQQGPKIIAERYHAADFLQRFQDLYRALLAGRPGPAVTALPEAIDESPSYDYLSPGVLQGKS